MNMNTQNNVGIINNNNSNQPYFLKSCAFNKLAFENDKNHKQFKNHFKATTKRIQRIFIV